MHEKSLTKKHTSEKKIELYSRFAFARNIYTLYLSMKVNMQYPSILDDPLLYCSIDGVSKYIDTQMSGAIDIRNLSRRFYNKSAKNSSNSRSNSELTNILHFHLFFFFILTFLKTITI